jgi:hypothetical protein
MLEDLFDLLGLKPALLTRLLRSMLEFKPFIVTKSEDANLIVRQIQMEEILHQLMEASNLVKQLSPFLHG